MKHISARVAALILIFSAAPSYAGIYCIENVTRVIVHRNGNIYFKTDKTCSNGWCQIDWFEDVRKERAFSLLLTARTTKESVMLHWDLESCDQVNETYSSPGSVQM